MLNCKEQIEDCHSSEMLNNDDRLVRRLAVASLLVCSLPCLAPSSVICQRTSPVTKVYRGSIGDSHIEMRLNIEGNNLSGTYSYDRIRQDLKLNGHLDEQGRLALVEMGANGKQSGKFACKRKLDDPIDPECTWSKQDGTREAYVTLEEQHIAFTNDLQIVPTTIANRKFGVNVSYPQISNGSKALSPAAERFNRRVLTWVQKAIKEFEQEATPDRASFATNYNALLATDNLISMEMSEDTYAGGAHPNSGFWTITYDLSGNKELTIDDLFKPDSDYKTAIAKYVVDDIDRRAIAFEQEEARREGRKVKQHDQPIVAMDELSELSGWAMTPKGLMVYFDFPHVIAVFDRTFVPYTVVKDYLKPNGPAARLN